MASPRRVTRYAWTVGLINGGLAVLLLNFVLWSLSSGLDWLVPWTLGFPLGLLTTWGASVHIQRLLHGQSVNWQPLAEGFAFMATAMLWDLVPGAWRAMAGGHDIAWGAIVFYSGVAGLVGAAIAGVLITLDLALVKFASPTSRIGEAS